MEDLGMIRLQAIDADITVLGACIRGSTAINMIMTNKAKSIHYVS